jgi:hypothetical protein
MQPEIQRKTATPWNPKTLNPSFQPGSGLAKDAQREAILLRNVLWLTLWTLFALIPTMLLIFMEMSVVWRAMTGILCALFWLLALRGMFRLAGLLDAGKRPISLNPLHAGKDADDDRRKK